LFRESEDGEMRKKYKYEENGVVSLIIVMLVAAFIYWFCLFFLPEYYKQTGKNIFPPEPEEMITEPAVMSTKMIQLAEEAEIQLVKEAIKEREKSLNEPLYKAMTLEVTAYAPFDNKSGMCADDIPNVTATGSEPGIGTIAVNPSEIPFGTRMYVESYGWGIASDTGQIIRENSNQIEVFMPTYEDAVEWGRKQCTVFVEIDGG
jgi:3D (Asp-Asp-Asp) domain-containing protein